MGRGPAAHCRLSHHDRLDDAASDGVGPGAQAPGRRSRRPAGGRELGGGKIGPEIVIEFAVPERAMTVEAITIHYHAGRHAYEKTFQNAITMCPPTDPATCDWVASLRAEAFGAHPLEA